VRTRDGQRHRRDDAPLRAGGRGSAATVSVQNRRQRGGEHRGETGGHSALDAVATPAGGTAKAAATQPAGEEHCHIGVKTAKAAAKMAASRTSAIRHG
jgi:hypothetical protein